MILKLALSILSFVISFSILSALAHEETDLVTGGIANCKLIGGNEKVGGTFKIRENSVSLDNIDRHLEVTLEGDNETSSGERSLSSEVDIVNVDSMTFRIGKVLETNASEAELIVEIDEGDKSIAVVALNQDENRNPLISSVKLLLTKIKGGKLSGATTVNYPRTVTLPLDSPEFAAIESEESTEIELQDATENGAVTLKCRFRNLPFMLIVE